VAVGSSVWLRQRQPGGTGLYIGFVADSEDEVNAAYRAAFHKSFNPSSRQAGESGA
jgi:hypothetical protein